MFLLVPAHPGFPGQIPQSRKTVVCVCDVCRILFQGLLENTNSRLEKKIKLLDCLTVLVLDMPEINSLYAEFVKFSHKCAFVHS